MARPTQFERDLHDIHGVDIDVEVIDHGTGRVTPPTATAVRAYPLGVRLLAGLAIIPLVFVIIIAAIVLVGALGLMWIVTSSMIHGLFS